GSACGPRRLAITHVDYPLARHGRVIGSIRVLQPTLRADAELLGALLDLAIVGLQGVAATRRSQQRLAVAQDRSRPFRSLHMLALKSAEVLDPGKLAQLAIRHACKLVGASGASIWLWDAGAQSLVELTSTVKAPSTPTPPGSGVIGQAFANHKPILVRNYQRYAARLSEGASTHDLSAVAVPLDIQGETIGVLLCVAPGEDVFRRTHVRALTLLAAQVAPSLRAGQLHAEVQSARALAQEHMDELTTIIDQMPSGVLVVDKAMNVRLRNAASRRIRGQHASTNLLIGDPSYALVHAGSGEPLAQGELPLVRAIAGEAVEDLNYVLKRPAPPGDLWVQTSAAPLRGVDNQITGAVMVYSDVTARRQLMEALQASEERYRTIVETANEGICVVDPRGAIVYVNEKMGELNGFTAEEQVGHPVMEFTKPADHDRIVAGLERSGAGSSATLQIELEIPRKDGTSVFALMSARSLRDADGQPLGSVAMFTDLTEIRKSQEALAHQALHDALTGLPNRVLLQDRLSQAMLQAQRGGTSLAVMFIDLDGFKDVNDNFGHHEGDEVLRQVGPRLQGLLRETDTVGRLGGDEFAVVLQGVDEQGASAVAAKMLTALEMPFSLHGQAVELSASIGIALYPEHGDDLSVLLQRADIAMYTSKRQHSSFAIYAAPESDALSTRLIVTGELRQAIEQDALALFYQPKVSFASGQIVGLEALVRWPHPTRGLIAPDQFVPLAEQHGLIQPLSQWVLRTALRQSRTWHDRGLALPIAVNLSMRDLRDPQLCDNILALLRHWEAPADWLRVEITETMIMADPRQTMAVVKRLHEAGIAFSIDDFGTGYSSLSYLRDLPARELKIDKSFVMDILREESADTIVRSVIDLAHNLGRITVAEGVESREVWDRLAALGCDQGQGYYMGKPLPAAELEGWLAESRVGLRALPSGRDASRPLQE
ncbi:MAG TPA: EAL domain-containing protein, partial [Chloroflexota bacterium]|nr:EAL domain-containing protein [Chloroflexota bacterium]